MELKIVKLDRDKTGILREDLTQLVTTPEEVRKYKLQMKQLCRKHNGIGLASNQVGVRANMFLIMPEARMLAGSKDAEMCLNPSYKASEAQGYQAKEGCLSLPGRQFFVFRHSRIQAVWTNLQGHRVERILHGTAAQVFQHEYDHLRGKTLLETGRDVNEPVDTSGNILMPKDSTT